MHDTVLQFTQRVLAADHFAVAGHRVLEVGSFNVNGSVRPLIESLNPELYLGVDAQPGPGVDLVADCCVLNEFLAPGTWDLVISTEMMEHVEHWRPCMIQIAAMIAPGGFLLLTTRSPGFPYHAFPEDYWRFTHTQMQAILDALHLDTVILEHDPQPGVLVLARRPVFCDSYEQHQNLDGIVVDRVQR